MMNHKVISHKDSRHAPELVRIIIVHVTGFWFRAFVQFVVVVESWWVSRYDEINSPNPPMPPKTSLILGL